MFRMILAQLPFPPSSLIFLKKTWNKLDYEIMKLKKPLFHE